jgi:23S rRNA pseudouridine1911/1915/1917 synthase
MNPNKMNSEESVSGSITEANPDPSSKTFLVTEDILEGGTLRLDRFLAEMLSEERSREQIKKYIQEGAVMVNAQVVCKPAFALKEQMVVALTVPALKAIPLLSEAISLSLVYEDDDLLVVNKPRGMLTHPTGKVRTGTLVNALLHHCGDSLSGLNGEIRPGIVHRLDRDTSGLLVVAKHDRAHRGLSDQLQVKSMRREYIALVQGVPKENTGTVNQPIGRNPQHRDQMKVTPEGRSAVTHWTVLETAHHQFSKMALKLETGRTHQIRVHMAYLGHPLVGDPLYGTGLEKIWHLDKVAGFQGQMLQAVRLSFTHPFSHDVMSFELPLEPLFEAVWQRLTGTTENAKIESLD